MVEVQKEVTHRRWSWRQFWFALALLPVGGAVSFCGLGIGLGVGDKPYAQWANPVCVFAFLAGPWIAGAGVLWLFVLVIAGPIQRFSLRTLLIAVAIFALILAIFANVD